MSDEYCVGHEEIRHKLQQIVQTGTIANAYLFLGKSGIGKKMVANEFAQGILCENPREGIACGKCSSCQTFATYVDYKLIVPEKDVIKVDTIRELIQEASLMPTIAKHKVFVLDEADKMNEQAQNALLKILEEPPAYVTLILIASSKQKLLGTILSRTVEFRFEPLSEEELKSILQRTLGTKANTIPQDQWGSAILFANGSAQKALSFLGDTRYTLAKELAETIMTRDFLTINKQIEKMKSDKDIKGDMISILEKVVCLFADQLKKDLSFPFDLIGLVEKTIENMRKNANVDLALDAMMIEICKLT